MWHKKERKQQAGNHTQPNPIDDECGEIFYWSSCQLSIDKSSLETNCPMKFIFVWSVSLHCQLFANLPKWFICWNGEHWMGKLWWMNYCFSFCGAVSTQDVAQVELLQKRLHMVCSVLICCTFLNLWALRSLLQTSTSLRWTSNKCFPPSLTRAAHPNQLICLTVCHQPHVSYPLPSLLFSLFLNIINKKLDGSCPQPPSLLATSLERKNLCLYWLAFPSVSLLFFRRAKDKIRLAFVCFLLSVFLPFE